MSRPRQTLRTEWYHRPEAFDFERRHIFGRQWLVVGHEQELPERGSAMARNVAGYPILVARSPKGELRAFFNVCRHRAGVLLWEGETERCKALRCKYHGWRYDWNGALTHTPDFGTKELDRAEHGLHALRIGTWNGLIFVCAHDSAPPLELFLADFTIAAAGKVSTDVECHARASYEIRSNWKTYVDNYLEGYHIPYLHPSLDAQIETRKYKVEPGDRFALHHVPARDGATATGLWAYLWPNVAINAYDGGMSVEIMNPIGPESMRLDYVYLFDPSVPKGDRDAAVAMSREVTLEDVRIVEAVQVGLASGAYGVGPLSPKHEGAVAAFADWVTEAHRTG